MTKPQETKPPQAEAAKAVEVVYPVVETFEDTVINFITHQPEKRTKTKVTYQDGTVIVHN